MYVFVSFDKLRTNGSNINFLNPVRGEPVEPYRTHFVIQKNQYQYNAFISPHKHKKRGACSAPPL